LARRELNLEADSSPELSTSQQKFRSVLKSTSLVGGSAFINIFIGMIKTKFIAVLLGPAGLGLINMFTSIVTPITTIAGMGLNTSGVRAIAEANGHNDLKQISVVVNSLRKTVWLTGFLGALATIVLAPWLSQLTFKNNIHANSIRLLGITVLLANIATGQTCILQGTRRIFDLAKVSILSAIWGAAVSVPCYWLWGAGGIIPSLVLVSIASLATSWWFSRKVVIEPVNEAWAIALREAQKLLKFGLPIMGVAIQGALVAYFMRLIIMNQFGLEGVGVWAAAFAISGILVNFVLNAMGTDYYPRLAAVACDKSAIQREVNAQVEIALLLATPALMITILFAPLGIEILYSGKFDGAIPILRWSVFGILGKVVAWPLGYIMLAQGRGKLVFFTDLLANFLHLVLTYFCCKKWGLPGTGISFMLCYLFSIIFYVNIAYGIARVRFSDGNLFLIVTIAVSLIFSSILSSVIFKSIVYYFVSGLLVSVSSILVSR
jgi:PST family polysaccharide transporter